MPLFLYAKCRCGRTLRARVEQAGLPIRCWSCGSEVVVPHPPVAGRLARALVEAVPGSLWSPTVPIVALGASVVTAAFLVPGAGLILALVLLWVAALAYGATIRRTGLRVSAPPPPPRPRTPLSAAAVATPAPVEDEEPIAARREASWVGRMLLALVALVALIAPVAIRNGGMPLPEAGLGLGSSLPGGVRTLVLLSLVGWLVAPVLFLLVEARDRHGGLPVGATLGALGRHPAATIAALIVLPLGLLVMEALLGFSAWQNGMLPVLVADLFPPPSLVRRDPDAWLVHRYDHVVGERKFASYLAEASPTYRMGLRRGYTLVGTIPPSLTHGAQSRSSPEQFRVSEGVYLGVRVFLSILILSGLGLLLTVQARWLGSIAALGSRRRGVGSSSGNQPPMAAREAVTEAAAARAATVGVSSGSVAAANVAATWSSSPAADTRAKLGPAPLAYPLANGPLGSASMLRHDAVPAPLASAPIPTIPAVARPLVLIIEDELAVADAVARILVSKGYGVMIAGDGEEGLRQARLAQPDVIVLDLLLPTMLGMEVCRALREGEATRWIPVVMATQVNTDADELAGLSAGADDFVAKPYNVDVLVARIQKQLHRRRLV